MGYLDRKLSERQVGGLPFSIATSLAIESVCGIHPEIQVTKAPILEVKHIFINLRTLIRNIVGSVETEVKKMLTADLVLNALTEELSLIDAAISKYGEGKATVIFYACSYSSLKRLFPHAIHREITTDLQKSYNQLERDTLKELFKIPPTHDIRQFDVNLDGNYPESFILTHITIDLLSKYSFKDLQLIESHTGKIKKPSLWNTKLTKGNDLMRIPFCKFSIQVFGDNGQLFSPMPSAIKKQVVEMAEADKWTTVSTKERLISSINKIKDSTMRSTLLSLL